VQLKITDYQAKYFAYELTKRCPSDSVEKLAGAIAGAQVPHNSIAVSMTLTGLAEQFGE
jgi:adenine-specific DNA-methyltransferase